MSEKSVYTVSESVLDDEELDTYTKLLETSIMNVVFGKSGQKDLKLLTDHELRKKKLADPRCVWGNNGNTRDSKLPKGAGTPNIYVDRLHLNIRSSESVIETLKDVHNTLFYDNGLEKDEVLPVVRKLDRPIYKPNATIDGPALTEIGSVVSILVFSIHDFKGVKSRVKPQSRGGPSILLGYYEYKEFIDAVLKMEDKTIKDLANEVQRYNQIVYSYHLWRNGEDPVAHGASELPEELMLDDFDYVTSWEGLRWYNIPCKPGDMVSFLGDIPWHLEKNSTTTPFSGLYLTTTEACSAWYNSDSRRDIINGLETGVVGKNSARGAESNEDERNMMDKYESPIKKMTAEQRLFYGVDKYTAIP